jgi:aspartate racemase
MKTIGLLGGMSWQSTIEYYRLINEGISRQIGGLHSGKIWMYSVDFGEIEQLQRQNAWDTAGKRLAAAAQALEKAGADMVLICLNTMHKVSDAVQQSIGIPLVHVADVTAEAVRKAGQRHVGLLGTRYTMEQDFLKQRLSAHGLQVSVPGENDRNDLHQIIFEQLCKGIFLESSKVRVIQIMESLAASGAEGVIWGCTEISLLLRPEEAPLQVFDTTALHAAKAVELALEG